MENYISGDYVRYGHENYPIKRAYLNGASSTGDNVVVAAVTGKRIRVLAMGIIQQSSTEGSVFRSNTTAIGHTFSLATKTSYVLPFNPFGWFETAVGATLNLNKSTTGGTDLVVQYIEI